MPPKIDDPLADSEPAEAEDGIPQEWKQSRRQNAEEWFAEQVQKKISDNKAAEEAAAEARRKDEEEREVAAASEREAREWRERMIAMRGQVEQRMRELTHQRERREEEEEKRSQVLNIAGMRLPMIVKVLPVVLLYDTDTSSFYQRYFIHQLSHMLQRAGLQVWWDRGQGVELSPDRLHYRMEAANRAELVVVVGSSGYFSSLEFTDEARLLYSRTKGGYLNGVQNLEVLHIPFEDDLVAPTEWVDEEGDLSFATQRVQLPHSAYGMHNWMDRIQCAATEIGNAGRHMLESPMEFFLQLATNAKALFAKGWRCELDAWRAANDVHPHFGLYPFQMLPLSRWSREDMLLAFSYLGSNVQPSNQLLADLGMVGWLLDAADESVLTEAGIQNESHRRNIMRLLDAHRDPAREGSVLDNSVVPLQQLDKAELAEQVHNMFVHGDRDGNGKLDPKEFKEVLRANRLELTKREMRKIMMEVDQNSDGTIDYDEFFPVMIELIEGMKAKDNAQLEIAYKTGDIKERAVEQVSSMTPEEVNFKLKTLFYSADRDNNGYLTRGEIRRCLESSELHLSRGQVNVLMAELDEENNGRLTYESFLPLALDLIVEMEQQKLEEEELTQQAEGVQRLLIGALRQLESVGLCSAGRVQTDIAEALLSILAWEHILNLNSMQIATILKASDPSRIGRVNCNRFAFTAAKMIDAYYVAMGDSRNPTPYRDKRQLSTIGAKNKNRRDLRPLDGTHSLEEIELAGGHSTNTVGSFRPEGSMPFLMQPSFLTTKSGYVCHPPEPSTVHTGRLSPQTVMQHYEGKPRTVNDFGTSKNPNLPDKVLGSMFV